MTAGLRQTVAIPIRGQLSMQGGRLVGLDGPMLGRTIELPQGVTVLGSEGDETVEHDTVSRHHCRVEHTGAEYRLVDLGSTNGTYIDGVRIKDAHLRPGSTVRIGETAFRFDLEFEPLTVEPTTDGRFLSLLGSSAQMRKIFAAVERVAPSKATVLIEGETGSGKGAVARAIHQASQRDGELVVFDAAAVTPTLMESELFGHERGAFTGAVQRREGALERVGTGTLFIDELTELSLALQPKLLRALEEREFKRVGGSETLSLKCRVIAASQVDLWGEVMAERFRRDLYFRLAVVTLPLPPLRDRRADIPALVQLFLEELGHPDYRAVEDLGADFDAQLREYDWPGNIRELRNVVERRCIMGDLKLGSPPTAAPATASEGDIRIEVSVPELLPFKAAKEKVLSELERHYLARLLERCEGNIARAAREAGLGRRHLYTLMAKHNLADE